MYYVCHKDMLPDELKEKWPNPREVIGEHYVYRCEDDKPCGFTAGHAEPVDGVEVDQEALTQELLELANAKIAAGIYEPVVLCQAHVKQVIDSVQPNENLTNN